MHGSARGALSELGEGRGSGGARRLGAGESRPLLLSGGAALFLGAHAIAEVGGGAKGFAGGPLAALLAERPAADAVAGFGDERESEHDDEGDRPIGDTLVAREGDGAREYDEEVADAPEPEHCHVFVIGSGWGGGQRATGRRGEEVHGRQPMKVQAEATADLKLS